MPHATGSYWVYLLASQYNGTLYLGVTNDLKRRLWQHKHGATGGFTQQHVINRLVYFEEFRSAAKAIAREKQLKGWSRQRKIDLLEKDNPTWQDLGAAWFDDRLDSSLRSE